MGANVTQSRDELFQILDCYPGTAQLAASSVPQRITRGLSGSDVWRLTSEAGDWAIRRWPAGYPEDRLNWVHQILGGLPNSLPVPIPLRTNIRQSYVPRGESLWNVEPWMPGAANFWHEPSEKKLAAAVRALADFHSTVKRWSSGPRLVPAIADRIDALNQHADSLRNYTSAIGGFTGELVEICRETLAAATSQVRRWQRALSEVAGAKSILIPCIRDLWHDHVLYTEDRVTGLIDFGSMRLDSIATDIARLVGSLVGSDERLWRVAMDVYRSAGQLLDDDAGLIGVIDGSSQCIAGLNWVRWLFVEKRRFENQTLVCDRLKRILHRLSRSRAFEI